MGKKKTTAVVEKAGVYAKRLEGLDRARERYLRQARENQDSVVYSGKICMTR